MSAIATATLVIGLVDKILDHVPTIDQMQRQHWLELKTEYNRQVNLELSLRDADLILNLKDAIMLFASNIMVK